MPVCTIKGFIIRCQRDNYKFWIPIKSVIECPAPQENNRVTVHVTPLCCHEEVWHWGAAGIEMAKVKTSKTREFYLCGLGHISMPSQTSVLLVWGCAVVSRRCRWAALETWDVAQKGAFLLSFLHSSTSGQVLILAIHLSLYSPNFSYRDFVILLFLSFLLVGCSPQP